MASHEITFPEISLSDTKAPYINNLRIHNKNIRDKGEMKFMTYGGIEIYSVRRRERKYGVGENEELNLQQLGVNKGERK